MSAAPVRQARLIFGDEADAIAYWASREFKVFAVDIEAGPAKRPTFALTVYARSRAGEGAIACFKRNLWIPVPRAARFSTRLAGPRELGCVPAPATAR